MNTAIKTQPTFSKATLQLIKKYLRNAKKFRKTLSIVRGDIFVYGLEGGNTDNVYTQPERSSLNHTFCTIEEVFYYCDSFNFEDINSNSIDNLQFKLLFYYTPKSEDSRYSHKQLLEQAFDVTKFWKYLFNDAPDYNSEIIGALNLYEWIEALCCEVGMWAPPDRRLYE